MQNVKHDCPHCGKPTLSRVHDGIPSQLFNCKACLGSFTIQPRIVKIEYDVVKVEGTQIKQPQFGGAICGRDHSWQDA